MSHLDDEMTDDELYPAPSLEEIAQRLYQVLQESREIPPPVGWKARRDSILSEARRAGITSDQDRAEDWD